MPVREGLSTDQLARSVVSREDLVSLLTVLVEELRCAPECWENADLVGFLQAMAAWCADSAGFYAGRGEDPASLPPWRVAADLLLAARSYE